MRASDVLDILNDRANELAEAYEVACAADRDGDRLAFGRCERLMERQREVSHIRRLIAEAVFPGGRLNTSVIGG